MTVPIETKQPDTQNFVRNINNLGNPEPVFKLWPGFTRLERERFSQNM